MQNITVEELKALAARLGFYNRPMDELINIIKTSTEDQFQKFETQLKIKIDKFSKKLEVLKNKTTLIKNKVGQTQIDSGGIVIAISGLFLISMLFYIGLQDDIMTAMLYLGMGTIGAVIVHLKPVESDSWKPILFSFFSILIVFMQAFIYYDIGYGIGQALIFSIPMGIMAYLLNEILFNSAFSLIDQSTAMWHRIHLTMNRFRKFSNHKRLVNAQKRLEASFTKKDLMIKKSVSFIKYEYDVAVLASDLKKNDLAVSHIQLNGKGHNYAN